MKNKNLWLSFIIAVGVIFVLTWVIPSGTVSNAGAITYGAINPTGIWDVFYYLPMLVSWFGQGAVLLLFVGLFYGVMNKTGALRVLEEKIASCFKKREKWFLVVSASFFILLSSLTGIYFPLIVFVPLFIGVILNLGYSKITSLIATIGSILVGTIGSLYATTFYTALSGYVTGGISYGWYKFILIIAGLLIINLYLFFTAKILKGKEKEEIDESMLFIEKTEGAKKIKVWPLVTTLSVVLVLFILGLTSWTGMYNFNGFADFHTKLIGIKIGSFAIFKSILGSSLGALGTWSTAEAIALIGIASIVLIFIYGIKWGEAFKGMADGIKKLLPAACLVLLANLAFVFMSQSGALTTIIGFFAGMTSKINVFTYSFASLVGASVVNENYVTSYVLGTMNSVLGSSSNLPLLVFIQQAMFGLAMLIAPTSAILLAGLSYLDIPYTKWVKNIWLLLLILVVVVLIVLTLAVAL